MSSNQEIYTNGFGNGGESHTNGHIAAPDSDTFLFSSESVGEGHPGLCGITRFTATTKARALHVSNKMCDQISDAVLDAHLSQDPDSRIACETATKSGLIIVFGEITSNAN
ncbi:unnamed protein product, partial [Oppiella nova]